MTDRTKGYSGTPLGRKLGIKEGFRTLIINEPDDYYGLFQDFPPNTLPVSDNATMIDFVHFFTQNLVELKNKLPELKNQIAQNGMIWVSWPKKASKVETDINDNEIRNLAIGIGLVDIKVCAVDKIWSGLKLVIPVKDRK